MKSRSATLHTQARLAAVASEHIIGETLMVVLACMELPLVLRKADVYASATDPTQMPAQAVVESAPSQGGRDVAWLQHMGSGAGLWPVTLPPLPPNSSAWTEGGQSLFVDG